VRVRDPKFSRFDTIPACDGQTRRQYKPRILERVQRTQEADSYVTLKATQGHRKERDEVQHIRFYSIVFYFLVFRSPQLLFLAVD